MLLLFNVISYLLLGSTCFSRLHDRGSCYQQYLPPQRGFPQAQCRGLLGGNRAENGVFIRNSFTCCKRRSAGGWGHKSGCQACSSIRGVLKDWGEWSSCSKSCGKGEQKRYRYCSNDVCAGVRGRRLTEIRTCVWEACCPVDGNWATWSKWSNCTASCGHGLQYRTRSCSSPVPFCGGRQCRSFPRQMQRCSIGDCASWSSWVSQSSCSVTCGIGNKKRQRSCYNPLGDDCIGEAVDYVSCNQGSCAVNGNWCGWSVWSSCTTTCQHTNGTRKRSRTCECPNYRNGGTECSGSDGEMERCQSNGICFVQGVLSDWSSWSVCSSEKCSSTPGQQYRTRTCRHKTLQGDHITCEGDKFENASCINLKGCLFEGTYGEWSTWSPCTLSCGSCGTKTRTRHCSHAIDATDTNIIGDPEFFCNDSKGISIETCHTGICPDGTDPCSISKDDEKEFNISTIDYSTTEGGEYYNFEASSNPDYSAGSPLMGFGSGSVPSESIDDNYVGNFDTKFDFSLDKDLFDSAHSETEFAISNKMLKNMDTETTAFDAKVMNGVYSETDSGPKSLPIEHTYEGSGNIDGNRNYNPEKTFVNGCEHADAKGVEFSRCCKILFLGIRNNSSIEQLQLQKCFVLHYETMMPVAMIESKNEDDYLSGRSPQQKRCGITNDKRLLKTICCLHKNCNFWNNIYIRRECKACMKHCQSCHNLMLTG